MAAEPASAGSSEESTTGDEVPEGHDVDDNSELPQPSTDMVDTEQLLDRCVERPDGLSNRFSRCLFKLGRTRG